MNARTFLDRAETLFALAPIQHLQLHGVAAWVEELADNPYLTRLVSLNLSHNYLGNRRVQTLVESPRMARLTELYLASNRIRGVGAFALSRTPYLGQLSFLDLHDNPLEEIDRARLRGRFGRRVLFQ
jgi:hypothetical protein